MVTKLAFWVSMLVFMNESLFATPTLADVREIVVDLSERKKAEGLPVTIEEVLDILGDRFPDLRENYVLLRNSRSRQKATNRHPRVITASKDAKFALAFNGSSKEDGFNELEMYEFSLDEADSSSPSDYPRSESFKFQRIIFTSDDGQSSSEFPIVKPVNEKLCRACHGGIKESDGPTLSIRPNWESYNLWEGTYFETDRHKVGKRFALEKDAHDAFSEFYDNEAGKGR